MLDRILTFLRELPGADQAQPVDPADDVRLAVVALLFHVINADGMQGEDEMARLRSIVAETYGLGGRKLDDVVRRAEEADREAVDLYSFTSVLNRRLDHEAKLRLIGLMWEVVFADGEMHELEDNVVWRVAELIGVEGEQRIAMRRRARIQAGSPQADDAD